MSREYTNTWKTQKKILPLDEEKIQHNAVGGTDDAEKTHIMTFQIRIFLLVRRYSVSTKVQIMAQQHQPRSHLSHSHVEIRRGDSRRGSRLRSRTSPRSHTLVA
jgi:hypothetical protein